MALFDHRYGLSFPHSLSCSRYPSWIVLRNNSFFFFFLQRLLCKQKSGKVLYSGLSLCICTNLSGESHTAQTARLLTLHKRRKKDAVIPGFSKPFDIAIEGCSYTNQSLDLIITIGELKHRNSIRGEQASCCGWGVLMWAPEVAYWEKRKTALWFYWTSSIVQECEGVNGGNRWGDGRSFDFISVLGCTSLDNACRFIQIFKSPEQSELTHSSSWCLGGVGFQPGGRGMRRSVGWIYIQPQSPMRKKERVWGMTGILTRAAKVFL